MFPDYLSVSYVIIKINVIGPFEECEDSNVAGYADDAAQHRIHMQRYLV